MRLNFCSRFPYKRVIFYFSLVAAGTIYFTTMIESFIFFPEKEHWQRPEDYGLSFEDAYPVTSDGVKLHAWYLGAWPSHGTILFLHGNAGNISHRLFKTAPLVKEGISLLLLDYRGFGKSEGRIKKGEDLFADTRAALDWLEREKGVPPNRVILFGESIGSAPALKVAGEKEVRGVILEAPFTTLPELGKKHYPVLPSFLVREFNYDNLTAVRTIHSPLLVIHGQADEICPFEMGQRLFTAAVGPKEFYEVPLGGHNDLPEKGGEAYFERIKKFVEGEGKK